MAPENETYLKTNQVRERYGNCSAMWIERRMKDSGFPPPVHFGVLRFWRVSDLVAWDAEQIKAAPKPAHDISPAHTPQARAKARRTKGEENRTWDKIL
jgi:predicted DNA-binding transcriptional regulator AlpA